MSYLCMSEFEDTHWDDFLWVDDSEVSCLGFEPAKDHFLLENSCNKSRIVLTSKCGLTENATALGLTDLGIEQNSYLSPPNSLNNMMENDSQSYNQSETFLSDQDMVEQPSSVAFDSSKTSDTNFSMNDTLLDDDIPFFNNTVNHPLGDISRTDLFENTDSTDFCNDQWTAMGNFEEVDRMFRFSDATFGIEISREDKLESEGNCGDTVKSGLKFPFDESWFADKLSENDSIRTLANPTALTSAPTGFETNICRPMKYDPDTLIGFHIADGKEVFLPNDQGHPRISVNGHSRFNSRRMGVGLSGTVQPRVSFNGNSIYDGGRKVKRCKNRFKQANQLDDIDLQKAANFHQLELVMEWLDLKTKLCIRDGLYRLAQGAERRHENANLGGIWGDESISRGSYIAEGTNKRAALVDMEIYTNPIDRSIAQLLFHSPSAASTIVAHD